MLSIFIMHASQQFYLNAIVSPCLIDQNILNNTINNLNYKPKGIQTIKLDIAIDNVLDIVQNTQNHILNSINATAYDFHHSQMNFNDDSERPVYFSRTPSSTVSSNNNNNNASQRNYSINSHNNNQKPVINTEMFSQLHNNDFNSRKRLLLHSDMLSKPLFHQNQTNYEKKILESYIRANKNNTNPNTILYKNYSDSKSRNSDSTLASTSTTSNASNNNDILSSKSTEITISQEISFNACSSSKSV